MVAATQPTATCGHCGAEMPSAHPDGRPRKYCGEHCARRGYGSNPGRRGGRPQKYFWTAELDDLMRRTYDGRGETIDRLVQRTGFPRFAVRNRAQVLGLARSKEPRWTPEQDDWLRANVTRRSWKAIAKQLGRTVCAVKLRAKRLSTSKTAGDETFTGHAVAQILGTDDGKVRRWIAAGLLPATRRGTERTGGRNGDFYRITPNDLRTFILRYPQELDLRRVEGSGYKATFLDVVAGRTKNGTGAFGLDGMSRGSGDEDGWA